MQSATQQFLTSENQIRQSISEQQWCNFEQIQLAECEFYFSIIPSMIASNLKQTYNLPKELWQLQQTNGFKRFKKGKY